MNTTSNTTPKTSPSRSPSPVWYKLGGILLLFVLIVLFYVFASSRSRHELNDKALPAGSVPGQPGPEIAH